MKRILVGLDGSKESHDAALFAADIAVATGAVLVLGYVIGSVEVLGRTGLTAQQILWTNTQREIAEGVLRQCAGGCARPGLTVETQVYEGPAAVTLADVAMGTEIDLVVVGHRGRNAVTRALLGSVADRLMQISPKPVLIVRGGRA